jgi:NDP-sugar pyrophosphorylase family protein
MIGLIPAGGKATRILGLPKMLLPIGDTTLFQILQRRMTLCHPRTIYVAPSPATVGLLLPYFGETTLAYGTRTRTMTEDMLLGQTYADGGDVLFGMPDTYFEDENAFLKLRAALDDGADVAVGLFETRPEQRTKLGMCLYESGQVAAVVDKPTETRFVWAWGVLAWRHVFWQHLRVDDPHVGYGLPRAIDAGLDVRAVPMDGQYWDCGTPDEYYALIRHSKRVEAIA